MSGDEEGVTETGSLRSFDRTQRLLSDLGMQEAESESEGIRSQWSYSRDVLDRDGTLALIGLQASRRETTKTTVVGLQWQEEEADEKWRER